MRWYNEALFPVGAPNPIARSTVGTKLQRVAAEKQHIAFVETIFVFNVEWPKLLEKSKTMTANPFNNLLCFPAKLSRKPFA
jgi:hypothetical protein